MADRLTLEIKGLKELSQALKQLPVNVGRNVLRSSVAAGAAVIRDEAKILAPVYTGEVAQGHPPPGTLRRAIIQKQIPELSSQDQQTFFVTVRHGKRYQLFGKKGVNLDAYYWWFVENGTVNMAKRPYLRPAFESKKAAAIAAIKDKMAQRIEVEAERVR